MDQCYDKGTGDIDSLAEGLISKRSRNLTGYQSVATERMDHYISHAMRNEALQNRQRPSLCFIGQCFLASGIDLAAVNIARGRDIGLPGYNKYRFIFYCIRKYFVEFSPG